jgi:restriction system protein
MTSSLLEGDVKSLRPSAKSPSQQSTLQGEHPYSAYPNFLGVSWQELPRNKVFPSIVFPMHTICEIPAEKFHELVDGDDKPPKADGDLEDPNAFVLEKYLEDFIVSNFDAIFKGKTKIYIDSEGHFGQQYDTDVGPIDILAVELKSKSFVIIELKKGRPSDQVIGQVLRYMGWVKKNLCNDDQAVKGLVICRDPDPKLSYALEMTNDIRLLYYTVSFKLTEAPAQ